ncbi:MAG: hypothetical protein Q7S59_10275 [Sulfurimonas sp.]|nr:hypothetical protein [Sulfurimonas sp.]
MRNIKYIGLGLAITLSLGFSGCGAQPKPVDKEILNGKMSSSVILHRESAYLGAALNMVVTVNGITDNRKLMSNDTNTYATKHNGIVVLQVESDVVKITATDDSIINCTVAPIYGSAFLENAFYLNGFNPRLDTNITCGQELSRECSLFRVSIG